MSQRTIATTEKLTTARPSRTEAKGRSRAADGARAKPVSAAERESMITLAAYFRAERRGFIPGQELED